MEDGMNISELLIQTYTELMDVVFTLFNYIYGMPAVYPAPELVGKI